MPETAGPELLRDWIERAARRGPDKPWVVSAEDGRSVSYGQLRDIVGRIRHLSARAQARAATIGSRSWPTIRSSICSAISA